MIKKTVIHLITGLNQGGAEGVLFRLILETINDVQHIVVSMMDKGFYGKRLNDVGIKVIALGMSRGRISLSGLLKVRQLIKETHPDIIQTWMYHANLLGSMSTFFLGTNEIVWNIRHSNLDRKINKTKTLIVAHLCGFLSKMLPCSVVYCSREAFRAHQEIGYQEKKSYIINNGYDSSYFRPDTELRRNFRYDFNIRTDEFLLGVVARWDLQKDHINLLKALSVLGEREFAFRCILVGHGMDRENTDLIALVKEYGLEDQLILAGQRADIPAVMNALDLHVLPSAAGEAFPNVVAESMLSGTPCVVTNVGDSALIVGDTGWVVSPRNPVELSDAIEVAKAVIKKQESRRVLGGRCRTRIVQRYSLERMVAAYLKVWNLQKN